MKPGRTGIFKAIFRNLRQFVTGNELHVNLFLLATFTVCVFPEFFNFSIERWFLPRMFFSFLLMFSSLILLAYYYNRLFTKVLSVIFLLAVSLNMGILSACLYIWRTNFSASEFLALLNTTAAEASPMILNVLPYAIISIVYFALAFALVVWGRRVLQNAIHRTAIRNVSLFIFSGTLSLLLVWCFALGAIKDDRNAAKRFWHATPLYCVADIQNGMNVLHRLNEVRNSNVLIAKPQILPNTTKNVIFILGESARRDALSIYGQPYETTPFASARIKNMLIFDSAIAASTHTLYAIPPMLCATPPTTTITPNDMANNILNLANLSDCWETYWISNQGKFGLNDSEIGIIAEYARHQQWMVPGYRPDGILLPYLDSALSGQATKRLIVLHLCGSHVPSQERYPAEFAYFDLPDKELSNYLNSIRYTDYFIEEVIRRVEQTPSIVLYLSDHGQARVDGKFVHSRTQKGVEVPYFIWHSDGVDSIFQQTGRITRPTSTATLFETMKFYLGLQTADHKPEDPNLTIRTPETLIPYRDLPPGQ